MTDAATVPNSPRLLLLARDIKLSHSVFAMPFAILGGYLAAGSMDVALHRQFVVLALIVVCMVLARTVAMTVNRLADRSLDAENPRTANRAIPSGKLSTGYVRGVTIACALGFIAACSGFWFASGNPWPVLLSPVVLAWLSLYSYTKRFTWLCHLFLGSALAISPIAAAIAVAPEYLARPETYLLAGMVMCWVAGFDVIYALQDVEADRSKGLYSMPSRLGVEPALWISRALHLAATGALVVLVRVSPLLNEAFAVGVIIVAGLLLLEHALVWRSEQRRIHMAFLTVNGVISVLLGALGVVDVMREIA